MPEALGEHAFVLACLAIATAGLFGLWLVRRARVSRRDPQRLFSWEQKKQLLETAGHRCEHKPLLWRRCAETERLQADHVVPWSRGGPTEVFNGQILCRHHNRGKSNIVPGPLYAWRLRRMRRKYRN